MFKVGDKVFCIDNTNTDLELNVVYNVIRVTEHPNYNLVTLSEVYVREYNGSNVEHFRFLTLDIEIKKLRYTRKEKINKIFKIF